MKHDDTEKRSLSISSEELLAFVRTMIGGKVGREDDDHPLPSGPWDPIIRIALERIKPHPEPWDVFGPAQESWRENNGVSARSMAEKVVLASILARHPEIWEIVGGGHSFSDEVALNPQPLPPRIAFLVSLAQVVISRAELFQEITDATRHESEKQGIIIVSGYVSRFIDDCGNGFKPKWPFPGPPPPWFAYKFAGIDFVVMATQFEQAAKETYSASLHQVLADAGIKLVEAGLSTMQ